MVRTAVWTTEPFGLRVGMRQGSSLSPFLFAIVMNTLTMHMAGDAPWNKMYTDDVVLLTDIGGGGGSRSGTGRAESSLGTKGTKSEQIKD